MGFTTKLADLDKATCPSIDGSDQWQARRIVGFASSRCEMNQKVNGNVTITQGDGWMKSERWPRALLEVKSGLLVCLEGQIVSGLGFHEETGRITTVKMEDSPLVEGKRFKIED